MDGREIEPDDDVILLDTLGELPSFYRLATVAFVGGSLSDVGGHNLLEPAMWRKPVFFGPFTGHMKETAERMKSTGGGKEVATDNELFTEVLNLLRNRQLAREMGERAHSVLQEKDSVLDLHLDAVERCFGSARAGRISAS
jgi:3-deoxy-D-manno-octulosonic-acid transferase